MTRVISITHRVSLSGSYNEIECSSTIELGLQRAYAWFLWPSVFGAQVPCLWRTCGPRPVEVGLHDPQNFGGDHVPSLKARELH